MRDLKNAVALVTGASRGIGKGIALALARAGAHVAVNFVSRPDDAAKVVAEITALGSKAMAMKADVSRSSEVDKLVADVKASLGPISILVNNAGILGSLVYDDIDEAQWDMVVDTNLKSAFLVTRAALPQMLAQPWGSIVNLSSVAAQTGGATGLHYAVSKAGLIGLTHSYARHLFDKGINVNAIAPALVETDMVTHGLRADPRRIPIGRFGTLEEAGGTAVLLVRNGYMTGQTVNLNGGLYMSS
jgi:3-oxoacyl-[acyl-carrier protein] reductase